MTLQNRVTPFGDIVENPARGGFTGNRGVLHDRHRTIRRRWRSLAWITCLLSFKGRQRTVMTPGHWTELFFLDEATALAAGHRPCAECRRADFNAYKAAWIGANMPERQGSRVLVGEIDRQLHGERLSEDGGQRRFATRLGELPDGTLLVMPGADEARLVAGGRLWRWGWGGYDDPREGSADQRVEVLTPRSTVLALTTGYRPAIHASAAGSA